MTNLAKYPTPVADAIGTIRSALDKLKALVEVGGTDGCPLHTLPQCSDPYIRDLSALATYARGIKALADALGRLQGAQWQLEASRRDHDDEPNYSGFRHGYDPELEAIIGHTNGKA